MSASGEEVNTDGQVTKSLRKLDTEFLQQVLQRWEDDPYLKVTAVDQSPACAYGVNFMSIVNRIVVRGRKKNDLPYQISLISKNLIKDECHQKIFHSFELFTNEARVYKVIPTLLGKDQVLVPNSLYVDSELILIEDLKPAGFEMVPKTKSLDFEHAKLALEALAEFHAASILLEYTDPGKYAEIRGEIKEVVFPPDTDHEGMKSMVNAVPKMTAFYLAAGATPEDDHAAEIAYFQEKNLDVFQMLRDIIKPKKYAVMCAGDCWITNFLFKYEEHPDDPEKINRKVTQVRMLDFQGARFASVAIDILYFLHTSVSHGLIEERIDELLEIYHSAFVSKLSNLPEEVLSDLSIDWLKNELKTHEVYGFIMCLWVAAATTIDEKHNIDGNTVASLVAENGNTPEYMKDKLSDALLTRVHDKCKYFLK